MSGNRIVTVVCVAVWLAIAVYPSVAESGLTPTAAAQCRLGDSLFRRADFAGAAAAYESALDIDSGFAKAWWGLGRIARLEFRRNEARDLFARAFRLDPKDPDIILAYAGFATDSGARSVLLSNIVAVTKDREPGRAERALAQLRLEERLGGERANRLASPYLPYSIKLAAWHPADSTPEGLVVPVSITGSKPLRLVLDTGARGIVIHARAARGLGLEVISDASLGGAGGRIAAKGQLTLARSISFGSLEFRDCPVDVSETAIAPGADGVLGPGIFQEFRVRIDAHARTLELLPHEVQPDAAAIPAYAFGDLLLVKAKVNRDREGLFLVDTGAAYTSIAADRAATRGSAVPLRGAQGLEQAFRTAPVELEIAGRKLVDMAPVAIDLQRISEAEGVEIAGVLGFSVLGKAPVTLNYRDGFIQIGR